ncbi:hypothetical protein EPUL_005557, partial [Erysiphe pulchra]
MLLFTNPTDVLRMVEGGVALTTINIGVSVDDKDITAFKKLNERGIKLEVCQRKSAMEITTLQIMLIFLVGCIAGIESILDEFQFHRPLLACTFIGLILGDITSGVIVGGTLEMIALGWMNIGAAVAPDTALAAIIATILVIIGDQDISASIALAIPIAAAGQVLTIIIRTLTIGFQHAADRAAEQGNLNALSIIHISALLLQAIRTAIPVVIVAISVSTQMMHTVLTSIPEIVTNGLVVVGGMIMVVGYA